MLTIFVKDLRGESCFASIDNDSGFDFVFELLNTYKNYKASLFISVKNDYENGFYVNVNKYDKNKVYFTLPNSTIQEMIGLSCEYEMRVEHDNVITTEFRGDILITEYINIIENHMSTK